MRRLNTFLAVVLLALTIPLGRLVYRDLVQLRGERTRAQAFAPPSGFRGLTLDGKGYDLASGPKAPFVGLFVLHRDRLDQELPVWNSLAEALAPSGVELVGTCDHADCAARVGSAQAAPRFTVLSAVSFQQARSLALLDGQRLWILGEKSGELRGVFDVPQDARVVTGLAERVSRSLREESDATPGSSS
jgi:hypothetical protein